MLHHRDHAMNLVSDSIPKQSVADKQATLQASAQHLLSKGVLACLMVATVHTMCACIHCMAVLVAASLDHLAGMASDHHTHQLYLQSVLLQFYWNTCFDVRHD